MSTSTTQRRRMVDYDIMSESSGYTGDEEEDMMTTASTDEEEYCCMKSSPFFHVAPRKRKRHVRQRGSLYEYQRSFTQQPAAPPPVPYKTSLYVLSQFLTNHMAQANGKQNEEPQNLIEEESPVHERSNPCVLSGNHLVLEDTLSFSLLPRILLEADRPHRVVHANAAYARGHGKEKEFQYIGQDLERAVMELFPSLQSGDVVMYPVWGSDRKADGSFHQVTHYLVEARPQFEVTQHQQVIG